MTKTHLFAAALFVVLVLAFTAVLALPVTRDTVRTQPNPHVSKDCDSQNSDGCQGGAITALPPASVQEKKNVTETPREPAVENPQDRALRITLQEKGFPEDYIAEKITQAHTTQKLFDEAKEGKHNERFMAELSGNFSEDEQARAIQGLLMYHRAHPEDDSVSSFISNTLVSHASAGVRACAIELVDSPIDRDFSTLLSVMRTDASAENRRLIFNVLKEKADDLPEKRRSDFAQTLAVIVETYPEMKEEASRYLNLKLKGR